VEKLILVWIYGCIRAGSVEKAHINQLGFNFY